MNKHNKPGPAPPTSNIVSSSGATPTPQPTMNRLELLHTIDENAELLGTYDAFALLAGRLPVGDEAISKAWEELAIALIANAACNG